MIVECACGKKLRVSEGLAGKSIRCPGCQAIIAVAQEKATPAATRPAPRSGTRRPSPPERIQRPPREARSAAIETDHSWPGTSVGSRQNRSRINRSRFGQGLLLGTLIGGIGLLATGGVWLGLKYFGSSSSVEVADNLVPAQPKPDSTGVSSDSLSPVTRDESGLNADQQEMYRIADEFAAFARRRDQRSLWKLVDQTLFKERLLGPNGSYRAFRDEIPPAKMLSHFGDYSIEGTSANGGHHHWTVMGLTKFRGDEAALLRYYSEPESPIELFVNRQTVDKVFDLVGQEELESATNGLLTPLQFERTQYSNDDSDVESAGVFTPRFGYLLLVFQKSNGKPVLCDIVNSIAQLPVSRSGGASFLKDWRVVRIGPGMLDGVPEPGWNGPKPEGFMDVFGETSADVSILGGRFLNFRLVSLETHWDGVPLTEIFAKHKSDRTLRMSEVAWSSLAAPERLQGLLEQFQQDFPDDRGGDLALLSTVLVAHEPAKSAKRNPAVKAAAGRVYASLHDPLMLVLQGQIAAEAEELDEAERLFRQAKGEGLETAAMHVFRVNRALAAKNGAQLLAAFREFTQYWKTSPVQMEHSQWSRVATMWNQIAAERNPPPSLADQLSGGLASGRQRAMDLIGRARGDENGAQPPGSPGPPNNSGSMRGPPAGFGQGFGRPPAGPGQPGSPPSGFSPPSMEAGPPGSEVVILITAKSGFDINKLVQSIVSKTGAKGYRASGSNNTGTIRISDSGDLNRYRDAIDFGTVESVDEATRTIKVVMN